MKTPTITLAPSIQAATETLAGNLSSSEPLVRYQQAKTALDNDVPARRLLEAFSYAQREVRQRQAQNLVTQASMDQLRSMQRQVQSNAVIMNYAETQQAAIAYLREVNQEISQWIGVDFASLARRSGCC
jgi:cell fate (sporulation/competence/biofilm development) regulator YlbF (YheA/YmcA/DUF963 family)